MSLLFFIIILLLFAFLSVTHKERRTQRIALRVAGYGAKSGRPVPRRRRPRASGGIAGTPRGPVPRAASGLANSLGR